MIKPAAAMVMTMKFKVADEKLNRAIEEYQNMEKLAREMLLNEELDGDEYYDICKFAEKEVEVLSALKIGNIVNA